MDGFKTLEELQAEEKVRDLNIRNTIITDVNTLTSGIPSAFNSNDEVHTRKKGLAAEIQENENFKSLIGMDATLAMDALEWTEDQLFNTYGLGNPICKVADQESYIQYRNCAKNLIPVMDSYLDQIKATKEEKIFMNALYRKTAERIDKGYPETYISYKTPLGENLRSFAASVQCQLENHKLQKNISKYRHEFPVYAFVQATNKQYDTLIEYWEQKKADGTIPEEKEQQCREKLYGQIVEGCLYFDKMMSAIENPVLEKEITEDGVLGNDAFHLHPLSYRGMYQTSASLETYKKCLENGWAIDDIAFAASFKMVLDAMDGATLGNGSLEYRNYKKYDKPVFENEEAEKHVLKMKELYQEIVSNPLENAKQRKKWLDSMDALVKEGVEKNYLKKAGAEEIISTVKYYNQIAKQRPLRDKMIELGRARVSFPAFDVKKLTEKMRAKDERLLEKRITIMEASLNTKRTDWWYGSENKEHKNLREAVEDLKKFYEENKGMDGKKPEEQKRYARQLLNRLDAIEHYAKIYIEKKGKAGTNAGAERLRGANYFKIFARSQKDILLENMKKSNLTGPDSTIDSVRMDFALSKAEKSKSTLEKLNKLPAEGKQRNAAMLLATDLLVARLAEDSGIKGKAMLKEYGTMELKKELLQDKNYYKLIDGYFNRPDMTGKKLTEEMTGKDFIQKLGKAKENVERKNAEIDSNEVKINHALVKKISKPSMMGL